jgi:hypothetical protein
MRKCADRPAKQRSPLRRNRPSTREIDESRVACVNCVVSASRSSQQHPLRRRRLEGLARLASPLPRHAEFLPTRILTGSSLARRGHAYDRFPVAGSKRSIPIAVFSPVGTTKLTALQALQKTGATGLEPATSGVTGRIGHNDAERRSTSSNHICRYFPAPPHFGSAWLSESSCGRLGHEWATADGGTRFRRQHLMHPSSEWPATTIRSGERAL